MAPKEKRSVAEQGTFEFDLGKAAYTDPAQREVAARKLQTALEEAKVPLDAEKFALRSPATLHVETLAITPEERKQHAEQILAALRKDYPGAKELERVERAAEAGRREPLVTLGPLAIYKPTPKVNLGLDLRGGQHLVLECRPETVMIFSTPDDKPMVKYEGQAAEYLPGGLATPAPEGSAAAGEAPKPAEKSGEEASAKPAEKPTEKPAEKPTDKPTEKASSWPEPTLTDLQLAQELDRLLQRNSVAFTKMQMPSSHQIIVCTEAADKQTAEKQFDLVRKYLKDKYGDALDAPDPRSTFLGPDTADKVKEIVDRRLYTYGKVKEPVIQTQGAKRLIVELPGIKDPEEALRIIGKTAVLEFRLVPKRYEPPAEASETGDYSIWKDTQKSPPGPAAVESVLTDSPINFTGADLLDKAHVSSGQRNDYVVNFELKADKKEPFNEFTRAHVGWIMAIVLDGQVQMAPVIKSAIPGKGIIEGNMGVKDANELALLLNAGALPVKIDIAENRTISATLGAASVRKSSVAGAVGFVAIFLFLIWYYGWLGVIANVTLLIYCVIVWAILAAADTTVTLPGIAGFLLSIGMAADGNIIIYERIREEVRTNKTLKAAVDAGFHRAWTAILDGQLTTLITAAVLYWLGTSLIKSFAVTLGVGVACSLFTAVTVTRWFCEWMITTRLGQRRSVYAPGQPSAAAESGAPAR
jgi:preprotein translocase subunit SecD